MGRRTSGSLAGGGGRDVRFFSEHDTLEPPQTSPPAPSELALGEDSPEIELPNDADPGGSPLRFRLRLFLLLMSLDWLAHGDFGPYAASVSKARRPCFKCLWTAQCACAFMSRDDPRRRFVTHSQHCQASQRRTHADVMQTVSELRRLSQSDRTKTAMKTLATETGVFSAHFASEHLLRDIVKDPTVDTMHLFFCGEDAVPPLVGHRSLHSTRF